MKLQYSNCFLSIFVIMLFVITSANAQIYSNDYKDIYLSVDTPAKFRKPDSILNAWLHEYTIYPETGIAKNTSVLLQLTIEKNGYASHPKVLIPNDTEYDNAAISTINYMPNWWTPAKYNGEDVRSYHFMTIKFDSATFEAKAKIRLEESKRVKNNDEEVFQVVEQLGEFPTGQAALFKFIDANLEYPKENPDEDKVKVIVRFVLEKDGSITNPKVVRGYSPAFDKAALEVVAKMPKWIPGKQRNNPVRSYFTLPIVFSYD